MGDLTESESGVSKDWQQGLLQLWAGNIQGLLCGRGGGIQKCRPGSVVRPVQDYIRPSARRPDGYSLVRNPADAAADEEKAILTGNFFDEAVLEKVKRQGAARKLAWNLRFINAIELSLRVAFACCLAAMLPTMLPNIPPIWEAYLPSIIIAIGFTVFANVGTTIMFALQGVFGTLLAEVNAFLLCRYFEDRSTTVAIVDFAVVTCIILWLNLDINTKLFTLSWTAYFAMTFASPKANLWDFMELRWDSEMVTIIIVQTAGSLLAILAVLLPYPLTALGAAKRRAARTAQEMSELLVVVTQYYCGTQANIEINIWTSNLERVRNETKDMRASVDIAWWEGFDFGACGVARQLLLKHVNMLKELDRQLSILQICSLREEFSDGHRRCMEPVKLLMHELVCATGELLMVATVDAADGYFDKAEVDALDERIKQVESLVKALGSKWHGVRKSLKIAFDKDLRTESFFILKVSSIAQDVIRFARTLVVTSQDGVEYVMDDAVLSVFDRDKLTSADHLNFVFRNSMSAVIAFVLGIFCFNFDSSMAGFVCVMLSNRPGSSLMNNLGRIQGTVLGTLAGDVFYSLLHGCDLIGMRIGALFIFECASNFVYHYSGEFGFIGGLLGVFGGKILVRKCESVLSFEEQMTEAAMSYETFQTLGYALAVISFVDLLFLNEPASAMARRKLLGAMESSFGNLRAFLDGGGALALGEEAAFAATTRLTEEVERSLVEAAAFGTEAAQEPRWHKAPWKAKLFSELCACAQTVHLDTMTMERRCLGPGSGLFATISKKPSFRPMKEDILKTLEAAETIVRLVLEHEKSGMVDPILLEGVKSRGNLGVLENLESLVEEVKLGLPGPKLPKSMSMADDPTSCLCAVFEMLDRVIQDLAGMVTLAADHL